MGFIGSTCTALLWWAGSRVGAVDDGLLDTLLLVLCHQNKKAKLVASYFSFKELKPGAFHSGSTGFNLHRPTLSAAALMEERSAAVDFSIPLAAGATPGRGASEASCTSCGHSWPFPRNSNELRVAPLVSDPGRQTVRYIGGEVRDMGGGGERRRSVRPSITRRQTRPLV